MEFHCLDVQDGKDVVKLKMNWYKKESDCLSRVG